MNKELIKINTKYLQNHNFKWKDKKERLPDNHA